MSEKRSRRRSDAEWDRLVDEWLSSGKPQPEFAKRLGIKPTTFQKGAWKSRKRRGLVQRPQKAPCHFVEVVSPPQVEVAELSNIRIKSTTTEIEIPTGLELSLIAKIITELRRP